MLISCYLHLANLKPFVHSRRRVSEIYNSINCRPVGNLATIQKQTSNPEAIQETSIDVCLFVSSCVCMLAVCGW